MDEKISVLLDDKKDQVTIRVPKKLLAKLLAADRKNFPGLPEEKSRAITYFAARGVLDWEDQHREDGNQKKPGRLPSED